MPATKDETGFAMERKTGFEPVASTLARSRSAKLSYFRRSSGSFLPLENHISELLMSICRRFRRPPIHDGSASFWWGVQVTILASRGIGFTDRSASLAEYHPVFFQLHDLKSKRPGTFVSGPPFWSRNLSITG